MPLPFLGEGQANAAQEPCPPQITAFLAEQLAPQKGFPVPEAVPLTLSDKQLLQSHAIAKFAQTYSGKPVVFESMHFGEKMDSMHKGEWLQAQFVKRVLIELFPTARFATEAQTPVPGEMVFRLQLADYAEVTPTYRKELPSEMRERVPALEEPYVLPMHLVKPIGSRRSISLSREEIRGRLGIPAEHKVVSLYIRAPDTVIDTQYRGAYPQQEINELLENLRKAIPFDSVILTFGNYDRKTGYDAAGTMLTFHSKHQLESVTKVSEALANPEVIPAKTVLVNNTHGIMPYLHRAADLAVVVGPVNFFEPIQAGTKTVLVKKTGSISRTGDFSYYDKAILDQLAGLGESTGMMASVNNYADLPVAVAKLDKSTEKASLDAISTAVFPSFLDSLQRHLQSLATRAKK